MKTTILSAALALLAAIPVQARNDGKTSGNPIFKGWYADPEGAVLDGQYWVFPTYSADFDDQTFMDAFSSPDLVTWTKHPRVLDKKDVSWARRAMWAPAVMHANGKYYLFFSANDVHEGEVGGIGVATASRPEGPYKDALGIVPFADGSKFREVTPENYVEGPFMLKRKGKYYFMWSEGGWGGPDYCVAYAIADSPFGPFRRVGKILQQDPAVATGAGHHSVIQVPGKDEYYIVYHRRPLTETGRDSRETCIDRLYFDKQGNIVPVKMTFEGVKKVKAPKTNKK